LVQKKSQKALQRKPLSILKAKLEAPEAPAFIAYNSASSLKGDDSPSFSSFSASNSNKAPNQAAPLAQEHSAIAQASTQSAAAAAAVKNPSTIEAYSPWSSLWPRAWVPLVGLEPYYT
jgi:hypothetical protein